MSLDPSSPREAAAVSRRQAVIDACAVVLLVPAAAVLAGLVAMIVARGEPSLATTLALQAVFALAGVHALLAARGQGFRDIGLRGPTREDVLRAPLVLLAVFGANLLLTSVTYAVSPGTIDEHLGGLESVTSRIADDAPLVLTALLMLLVGLYEEIAARGLLLQRLATAIGGNLYAAAVLSSLLFALGHFYQGVFGVVQTALFGFVLALSVIRFGSLWPAILAHAAINTVSIVLLDAVPVA